MAKHPPKPKGENSPFLEKTEEDSLKLKHGLLRGLHMCGILSVQVIVASVLSAFILWLFLRIPEPEVNVESFSVDQINGGKNTTNLHYVVTLHNPDIYKSIRYEYLVMRVTYTRDYSFEGVTINFGKGIRQGPGHETTFANQTADYSGAWLPELMPLLRTEPETAYLNLKFVMQFNVMGITRQRMRTAELYFDYKGDAFITRHIGLRLK